MKRLVFVLATMASVTASPTCSALAGGDKVRGDNGQGAAKRVQV